MHEQLKYPKVLMLCHVYAVIKIMQNNLFYIKFFSVNKSVLSVLLYFGLYESSYLSVEKIYRESKRRRMDLAQKNTKTKNQSHISLLMMGDDLSKFLAYHQILSYLSYLVCTVNS